MIKFKTMRPESVEGTSVARSVLALSTALLLSTTAPLIAADFTIVDGQTETNQDITLGTGETGTILVGGTIQDHTDVITATGDVTIDNAGTVKITSGGADRDGIEHTGGMLTLINRETGEISGNDRGVVTDDTITSLINFGTINGVQWGVVAVT